MNARTKGRLAFAAVGLLAVVGIVYAAMPRRADAIRSAFAKSVDLTPLSTVAVQSGGRLKSFDSFARSGMKFVSGSRSINGQPAAFTYLDLLFRPHSYHNAEIIFIKHKDVRERILQKLASDPSLPPDHLMRYRKTGLFSSSMLARPEVVSLLDEMSQDLIRTSKAVDAIRGAFAASDARNLLANLAVVPPPGEDAEARWFSITLLAGDSGAPRDSVHADVNSAKRIPGLDPQKQVQVSAAWAKLASAWGRQDAPASSAAIADLARALPTLNPQLYPPMDKLRLESWYFRYKGMVWTWMIYLLAIVPLLMSTIYHWPWARRLGLSFFLLGFALHTTSIGIRWHLSGRIPNSNMFEAIMASTWFVAAAALTIEVLVRRRAVRNLFALGASVCAMVAMMCSHLMPVTLSSDIEHVMPVLNDVWLYIHTNVIISSYGLIGAAAVIALIYLCYRLAGGSSDCARAGGAGELILAGTSAKSFIKPASSSLGVVLDGATMVLMELAFVLLWTGLCMGAIWADHSWGRPWGWDPKEVFALNTFIMFLVLVHVRLKVRDKALWTAILACVGCGVMLFNWIVVNFVITGLHSYA